MKGSRNAPCPCGSGRKYKRCCLAAEHAAVAESRRDDAVGVRILRWSAMMLSDELQDALAEFGPTGPGARGADLELFSAWFHNDRELPGGWTPAELYARRVEMSAGERDVAERIAGARLGIHRVVEVEPGRGMELLDLIGGGSVRVASRNVSREAVRWDVLLGRIMEGDPASLWGPVRTFTAAEESELLTELGRLARTAGRAEDRGGLEAALRDNALAMVRFATPSSLAEPSFYTPEGDPVAESRASWELTDPAEAKRRLAWFGGFDPAVEEDEAYTDITVSRAALFAERTEELPTGAIVFEASPLAEDEDVTSVATVRLEGGSLIAETMSEPRLRRVIGTVEADFGDLLAGDAACEVVPIGRRLAEHHEDDAPRPTSAEDLDPAEEQRLLGELLRARYRRWLDEPNPSLAGATPRGAARAGRRDEVVSLARGVENGAARSGAGELDLIAELESESGGARAA